MTVFYRFLAVSAGSSPAPLSPARGYNNNTIMADNNDAEKMTAAADEAAGKKFKLSEIVAALRNHDVELDCKAVISYYTDDFTGSVLDIDLLDIHHREDVLFLLIHGGVQALMHQANEYDPKALSVLVEAEARKMRDVSMRDILCGFAQSVQSEQDDDAADGKEGADHE